MAGIGPIREVRDDRNSFGMCRSARSGGNSFSFRRYTIASHLFIPKPLQTACLQAPARISGLTYLVSARTQSGGGWYSHSWLWASGPYHFQPRANAHARSNPFRIKRLRTPVVPGNPIRCVFKSFHTPPGGPPPLWTRRHPARMSILPALSGVEGSESASRGASPIMLDSDFNQGIRFRRAISQCLKSA